MKAGDTVMNATTKRQFIYIKNKPDLRGFIEDDALLCQAEISFKAGIREVVDFVENILGSYGIMSDIEAYCGSEWEIQKEEWGIE